MRILMLNYEFPPLGGGGANFTRQIARESVRRGHQVAVMTSGFRGLPRQEIDDGVRVIRIPTIRRRQDRCTMPEMVAFLASSVVSARNVARRWQPDVLLAFFGIPCGPAALAVRKAYGIPYIVALCGGDVPGFQPYELRMYHALTRPIIRQIWREAAAVVANSRGLRDLASGTAPDLSIEVIPHGAAPALAPNGSKYSRPTVAFSGRLVEQKGLPYLLHALPEVARSIPDVRLELMGDGPMRIELEREARALGIADRLTITGWISREEVSQRLQRSSVFVLPSLDEGMSNSLLEAMAAGLPVVSTRVPGSEELVEHGVNGYLVPVRDSGGLAQPVSAILRDRDLAASMGQHSRAVAQRFDWGTSVQSYLNLCRTATASDEDVLAPA